MTLFFLASVSKTFAADVVSEPDPSTNPALAVLIKSGVKFFYLGRVGDLDGWVGVKDGQIQTFYRPLNNAYVSVGHLFGSNGENLTGAQVKKLMASNKELAALVAAAPPTAEAPKTDTPKDSTPKAEPTSAGLPVGERFLKELKDNASVTLGTNIDAPLLFVILSPNCLDCHEFWGKVQAPVVSGLLRVRLYVAGLKNSSDERIAAQLLETHDPLTAWNKYEAGDFSILNGDANHASPHQPTLDKVRALTALINKWRLPAAPYLLYRAKNGQVKVVEGKPSDLQVIISDAVPEKPEAPKP